jgi:hypothetical protein
MNLNLMFTKMLTSIIGRFDVLQSKSECLNAIVMQEIYLESVFSLEPRALKLQVI